MVTSNGGGVGVVFVNRLLGNPHDFPLYWIVYSLKHLSDNSEVLGHFEEVGDIISLSGTVPNIPIANTSRNLSLVKTRIFKIIRFSSRQL